MQGLGERLAEGIQPVHVLLSDEALLLTAVKEFDDVTPQGILTLYLCVCRHYHCWIGDKVKRNPGDRWMINGPTDYVPPIEVSILESRFSSWLTIFEILITSQESCVTEQE